MDPKFVMQKLAEVLVGIQTMSGLECPPITEDLKPVEALNKFDSKIWPVATGMLAAAINRPIPNNANIFGKRGTKTPLTVRETVALVCQMVGTPALAAE